MRLEVMTLTYFSCLDLVNHTLSCLILPLQAFYTKINYPWCSYLSCRLTRGIELKINLLRDSHL